MDYDKIKHLIGSDKVKNRVYRVGIELEGGWDKVPHGIKLEHDGSVVIRIPATKVEDVYSKEKIAAAKQAGIILPDFRQQFKNIHTGEIPSMILEPKDFPDWVNKYYPNYVNETCGMHMHMSFETALHYSKLMTPDYGSCIVAATTAWAKDQGLGKNHPIWKRLAGKNQYCQAKFWADDQARKQTKDHNREGHGNRYTMISYPYSLKGTIECRLLPMMDTSEQAVSALKMILNTTNACLSLSGGRKGDKAKKDIHLNSGDEVYNEQRRLVV